MSKFSQIVRRTVVGIITVSALASAPAIASPAGEQPPSVKVYYSDLDLASAQGREELRVRITKAAKEVCQFNGTLPDIHHMVLQAGCMKKALAAADIQVADAVGKSGRIVAYLAMDDRPVRR